MFANTIEHNPRNIPSAVGVGRWTPVLNGDVYCSPACGCGCKKAAYDKAVESANTLAATLGHGWEPNVWENCKWYYQVTKGDVTVTLERDGYNAKINFDYIVENYILAISETNTDPRCAVENLTLRLAEIIARLSRAKASVTLEAITIEK
jgi:ribosome-associated translation inhibitor RaiA